ncbi:hypothetical protein D3C76_1391730 [compost metagenome]
MKEGAGQSRQLFADELPVFMPVGHIGIEAPVYRRHHHSQSQSGGIALNGGAAQPNGVIVGQTVQEVQRGMFAAPVRRFHADLVLGHLGYDHIHRGGNAQ